MTTEEATTRMDRLDAELGMVRRCSTCQEEWPSDREFFKGNGRGTGLRRTCRSCQNQRTRERHGERLCDPAFIEARRARWRLYSRRYYERRRAA